MKKLKNCVKIYDKKVLTLPGGFRLPVCFIKETHEYYRIDTTQLKEQTDFSWAEQSAKDYLISHMIAGKILSCDGDRQYSDDIYCFCGEYFCVEMIGQYKQEEIMEKNE